MRDPRKCKLPGYLPPTFKSWTQFFVHILQLKERLRLERLPKNITFEWDEMIEGQHFRYMQAYNLKTIKARAFDELLPLLPTRREADQLHCDSQRFYSGGPGADASRKLLRLWEVLPLIENYKIKL